MDPMKPVCSEPNRIEMPSLKDVLLHSIDILDEHFSGEGIGRKVIDSWSNVRESAISFADIFDKLKDGGGSSQ